MRSGSWRRSQMWAPAEMPELSREPTETTKLGTQREEGKAKAGQERRRAREGKDELIMKVETIAQVS